MSLVTASAAQEVAQRPMSAVGEPVLRPARWELLPQWPGGYGHNIAQEHYPALLAVPLYTDGAGVTVQATMRPGVGGAQLHVLAQPVAEREQVLRLDGQAMAAIEGLAAGPVRIVAARLWAVDDLQPLVPQAALGAVLAPRPARGWVRVRYPQRVVWVRAEVPMLRHRWINDASTPLGRRWETTTPWPGVAPQELRDWQIAWAETGGSQIERADGSQTPGPWPGGPVALELDVRGPGGRRWQERLTLDMPLPAPMPWRPASAGEPEPDDEPQPRVLHERSRETVVQRIRDARSPRRWVEVEVATRLELSEQDTRGRPIRRWVMQLARPRGGA